MNFEKTSVRMLYNSMWIDIKVTSINQLHQVALMGGRMLVYEVCDIYYLGFVHECERVNLNFYGLTISKEQFEFQIRSWGDYYLNIAPGTELLLADNLYFI